MRQTGPGCMPWARLIRNPTMPMQPAARGMMRPLKSDGVGTICMRGRSQAAIAMNRNPATQPMSMKGPCT